MDITSIPPKGDRREVVPERERKKESEEEREKDRKKEERKRERKKERKQERKRETERIYISKVYVSCAQFLSHF